MNRKNIINLICAVAIGSLTYGLMNKSQISKEERRYQKVRESLTKHHSDLPIEEAGYPGKDEFDNSNMVAEGSQFGVQYYNHVKQ